MYTNRNTIGSRGGEMEEEIDIRDVWGWFALQGLSINSKRLAVSWWYACFVAVCCTVVYCGVLWCMCVVYVCCVCVMCGVCEWCVWVVCVSGVCAVCVCVCDIICVDIFINKGLIYCGNSIPPDPCPCSCPCPYSWIWIWIYSLFPFQGDFT